MKYLSILILITTFNLYAQPVGKITHINKEIFKLVNGSVVKLKNGDTLNKGDQLKTISGQAEITFDDLSKVTVTRGTKLTIEEYIVNRNDDKRIVVLNLKSGGIKVDVPQNFGTNSFKVKTKLLTVSVKGTIFTLRNSGTKGVELNLLEGSVIVNSNFGKFVGISIKENQYLTLSDENSLPDIKSMNTMKIRALRIEYKITQDGKADKDIKKFENLSNKKIVKKADSYISKMREILKKAFLSLKKVRKEKELLKINCINTNVMTIKGYLRRSEDNRTEMDSDKKKKNMPKLLTKIYIGLNNSKQAYVAIKSCSGDILTYDGNKSINLEIDDIDVDDKDISTIDVVFVPTPVSPFF